MSDHSAHAEATRTATGRVALVGAGPGDPDLLTIKAARLIAEAEIVFADRLVGEGVMKLVSPAAQVVPVGKSKGEHSVPQDEIHRRMIETAKAGKRVVRLKGGDPFIFGRGGEEVEALRAAGVEVEVVPGISAALGVAAVSQIPLTHRDIAQAVTFVTGHAALGKEPDLDWVSLARPNQTVVVFMGVGTAEAIAARLIAAGRDPATPVAVVENGTRDNEIRAFGSLGNVADVIQESGIQGPALLIIGEVVALAQREADVGAASKSAKPTLASLWEMLS
jgi:uroporphyrin-III C-methyltransferase/precorrin-2 dehydrogenase/sirohydrochlorin ferrochelatase